MAHTSRALLLATLAAGCPRTVPTETGTPDTGPGEAPALADAEGLSCYREGVADGPNYQLARTGGVVTGMSVEIDINGETVARHEAADLAISDAGAPPLATYTGTLGERATTIVLVAAVSPEQRFAHYRGTVDAGDGAEALVCYRF